MNNPIPNESDKDPIVLKDRVFSSVHGFKEWIEETQLFQVLKQESNNPSNFGVPTIKSEMISINFSNVHIKISTAYDLPIEIIEEFFRNSPFYEQYKSSREESDVTDLNNLKLLN